MVAISILFLVSMLGYTWGQLTSHWTQADLESIKSRSEFIIRTSKSSKDIYFSLQLLGHLVEKDKKEQFCDCENILRSAASSSTSTAFEIAYSLKTNDICKCGYQPTPQNLNLIQSSLQSEEVSEVVGGLYAGNALKNLSLENQLEAINKLRGLLTVDGELSLLHTTTSTAPSDALLIARQLLDTLADLPRTESNIIQAFIEDVYDKAFQFIPSGNHEGYIDVLILAGLSKLSESEKVKLSQQHLIESSDALLAIKYTEDPYSVYQAYEASLLLSRNKKSPIYLDLQITKFSSSLVSSHILEIVARNILGKELKIESLEVVFIKLIGKDQSFFQGKSIEGNKINFSELQLSAGRYQISILATIKNKPAAIPLQSYFLITDEASIVEVYAGVTASTSSFPAVSDLIPVSIPNSLVLESAISANHGDILHVTFQVTSLSSKIRKPHQSIVRITEESSGHSVYYVATKTAESVNNNHEYTVSVNLLEDIAKFGYKSGQWILTILVADTTYRQGLEYVLGSVEILFPSKPGPSHALYGKALLHASDVTLTALPEIEHQMRPPAKRASPIIAGIFTLIVLLPLLFFLGFLTKLQLNLSRLRSLSSIGFVIALIALFALYVGYWLALDGFSFYQTIQYLCFLFPVIIFIGSYALSSVMETRLNEEKQLDTKNKSN